MQHLTLARRTATGPSVEVFVAACTGTGLLTGRIGRPVVLIDVADDAEAAVDDLNRRRVGSGTLWPNSFQPLDCEADWDDWRRFDIPPVDVDGLPIACDAAVVDGRIRLELPDTTVIPELREQLSATLRHLRMQDVVRCPAWLEERSDLLADIIVHPRYELPRYPDFRDARLVDNLYVIDPAEDALRLLWLTVAACFAANERTMPCRR